ncbi:tetratricopeptide repeat protein [Asticcacaulis sp. YBE204]|uniref:tetratricopeptide repeat protein n=1 Tax=Asticcacaulis sp. YBE204 TaxID=1282363 RepID=UPI00041DE6C7|nr:tetratricopeptide repeat protein [Asticcacaulis sp. YBE204]
MFRSLRVAIVGALIVAAPSLVTAQSTTPATTADDITDVTVFLRRENSIPGRNIRIPAGSASSCRFIGTSGGDSDYIQQYLAATGSDPSAADDDSGYININAPYGDASRDSSGGDPFFSRNDSFGGDQFGDQRSARDGCTQADYNFAAGRAHIARNDRTLSDAYALFDQKKYPEAFAMFKKSYSKMGYPQAGFMIGKMYLYGVGTEKNAAEAIKWLRKVADAPRPAQPPRFDPKNPHIMSPQIDATISLAKIYLVGFGVPQNRTEALKWYRKAAGFGYIPAHKTVGDFYYFGYGTPRDFAKAAKTYKVAATFDYAPAQFALAQLLEDGQPGVPADPKQALAWYSHAAKWNHPGGLYALAVAYDTGQGVKADPAQALYFYKEAAVRGHPDAQNAIGTYFYRGGSLLPKDAPVARKWFDIAARNGNADAMFNLAVMYMKGEGGAVDRVKAWAWFTLAGKVGHPDSKAAITALEPQMSATERAEAEALFKPKP